MTSALLIIDIQRDYFPGGAYPLIGSEEAAAVARAVLVRARDAGQEIIHVQHHSLEADAGFFRAGTPGIEIHPLVAPMDGEQVITKHEPNSFIGTPLEKTLRANGIDELVIVGMMSSMCVDATTRAALDLGFAATVIHDACAAPDLEFDGTPLPGRTVHAAFMAALADAGAIVVSAADYSDAH